MLENINVFGDDEENFDGGLDDEEKPVVDGEEGSDNDTDDDEETV